MSKAAPISAKGCAALFNITLGKLVDTRADELSRVTYGTTTRTQGAETATQHGQSIPAGTLQINGKNGMVALDGIAPASTPLERMGQVVEAINAKTYEHGVTAYLTKLEGSDDVRIDIMSDGVYTDGVRYLTVEFFGFTPQTTGMGPTNPNAATEYLLNDALDTAIQDTAAASGAAGDSSADKQLFVDVATALNAAVFPPPHTANMDTSIDPLSQALQDYLAAVNAAVYNDPSIPAPNDRLDIVQANTALRELSNTYRVAVLDSNIKEETGMGIGSNSGAAGELGIANVDVSTQPGAWVALKKIDSAIDQINSARATLGAMQTRFETAVNNIDIQVENLSAARGRIVDADFAKETANLARVQILQQAGMAMVAQANQIPQNVLQLLQG